jgi:hypothetical protein
MTNGIKISDLHNHTDYKALASAQGWSEAELQALTAIDPNHNGVIDNKKERRQIKEFLKRADKGLGGNHNGTAEPYEIYRTGQRAQLSIWSAAASKKHPFHMVPPNSALGAVQETVKTSEKWVYYQGIIDAIPDAMRTPPLDIRK